MSAAYYTTHSISQNVLFLYKLDCRNKMFFSSLFKKNFRRTPITPDLLSQTSAGGFYHISAQQLRLL